MPIYEYECAACGRVVEKWQKFSEAPLAVCSHCGGSLHKLISSCSFHLKGGGWYVKDYGSGSSCGSKTDKKVTDAVSTPADSGSSCDSKPAKSSFS